MFSSRNSRNLLNDLCPTSRDGLLGVRTLSSAEGLAMIIKTALGLELRMSSLAAMLIYVSSRVHVYLVDWSMSLSKSRKNIISIPCEMWRMRKRIRLRLCRSSFPNCSQRPKTEMSASGRIVTAEIKWFPLSSLKAVQQSNLQVRHRRHRLLDVVQRVNNVQFHQQTSLLQISSEILNQSSKVHLCPMPQ